LKAIDIKLSLYKKPVTDINLITTNMPAKSFKNREPVKILLSGACLFFLTSLLNYWIPATSPELRAHHALVYDEKSKTVFLTGGSTPLNGGQSFRFYNDIWNFNRSQWEKKGESGHPRSGMQLAFDSRRGKIFSFGGYSGGSSHSDLRHFENGNWQTLSYLPENRAAEPGFVYDESRDKLVVFGGSESREILHSTTWEWDGKTWTSFKGQGPEARQAFAMVYDSKRKRTVLFGGMGKDPGQSFSNTWEFDGTKWEKLNDAGPGSRLSPGFCYDKENGVMLFFGGATPTGIAGDTWGWDGKEWKKLAETGPPARMMGYMCYDKDRKKAILFGGRLGWPNDANDTWEWDGKTWKEIK
jgi:N-acetylneuraminic acid mutarotase